LGLSRKDILSYQRVQVGLDSLHLRIEYLSVSLNINEGKGFALCTGVGIQLFSTGSRFPKQLDHALGRVVLNPNMLSRSGTSGDSVEASRRGLSAFSSMSVERTRSEDWWISGYVSTELSEGGVISRLGFLHWRSVEDILSGSGNLCRLAIATKRAVAEISKAVAVSSMMACCSLVKVRGWL
jgi:hypothetical protein